MTYNAISTVSIAVLAGLNLAAWFHFARNRRSPTREERADNLCMSLPMSAFSDVDHPDLETYQDDVSPLTEAEIYVIYGRERDAQNVLALALREGRITPEEISHFWSKPENAVFLQRSN